MCATLGAVLRIVAVAVILACTALAAAGCGGSDKPAVCSARDDLTKSVDTLIDVNPVSDGAVGGAHAPGGRADADDRARQGSRR